VSNFLRRFIGNFHAARPNLALQSGAAIGSCTQERSMRKYLVALTLSFSWAMVGCEDGPDQPFQPASDNAASNWNNGVAGGYSDPSKQGYSQDGSASVGTNKQEICNAETKAARWKVLVKKPLEPPRKGGNIDLAGDDTWKGITIEEAEQINCQSDELGDWGGTPVNAWGDNQEVWFVYNAATRKGISMHFWPGYTGTLDFHTRDGKNSYKVNVNGAMTKDGEKWPLHWQNTTKFRAEVDEIGSAVLATYAPSLPDDATAGCTSSGMCILGSFGDVAYIFIPALGLGLWTPNQNASEQANILDRVDIYLSKVLPFGLSYPLLKLDAQGPTATPRTPILNTAANQPCVLRFGMTYSEFMNLCVKVTGDPAIDDVEENKLFGGFAHGREQYHFDVWGVDVDFASSSLAPDKIISDTDRPVASDLAGEFTADQSVMGKFTNDRIGNDPLAFRDNHGAGLVYMEYARLVQAELSKYIAAADRKTLGDPACLAPAIDPANPKYPKGCTGFEGFVTCSPKSGDAMLDKLAAGADLSAGLENYCGPGCAFVNYDMVLGLKPGHPSSTFCFDIPDVPEFDSSSCSYKAGYTQCITGDLFATSFDRVLDVFGGGKLENMPYEIRDTRFFFRQYSKALTKYLLVAGGANETVAGVHDADLVIDDLHFDSAGAGQFETAAYVDRRFVDENTAPTEITYTADVKNGIFNDYQFARQMYRGETLLYAAARDHAEDPLGKEFTGTLTNVFGSPVLRAGWKGAGMMTAYQCATADPPARSACGGQTPPLDADGNTLKSEDGRPILEHYKAAFEGSQTAFTLGMPWPVGVDRVKVTDIQPFLASAYMTVPLFETPYDPTTPMQGNITRLIPYEPKQPGLGFNIPINGQLDRFVQTYHCDLSGRTISLQVMWDWELDPDGGQPLGNGSVDLKAVQSGDFLGEVFLCQDPADGSLLRAHMYTTTDELLDWMIARPDATAACQMIVRYSPFGNYPDYISSLANGVTIGITQGGGKGRVVDALLFVPGQ
jgi:hypothetical protein